ncbi:MAG: O-methyltransferase [Armatimonadota bacterium]
MSSGNSINYKLRPNKSVDRELFLSMLSRLCATINIEQYKYVSLGGPFLEDFRLVHARTGITDLVCVECDEATYNRQLFNKPLECIECVHSSLEDYLSSTGFETPLVLWLDYTDPSQLHNQLETFANQAIELPLKSILRITLNANPSSLGKPDASQMAPKIPGQPERGLTEHGWRLQRFRERMADYCPSNLTPDNMTKRDYGKTILKTLQLAVEKALLDVEDREIEWGLSTMYSDGTIMVTATLIIVPKQDDQIKGLLENWAFVSKPDEPMILDLPALSTIERLTMERYEDPRKQMGYDLPLSNLKENPITSFKKFYRVFPQFARVDL